MRTLQVWVAAGALWVGCLLPGPWLLLGAGLAVVAVALACPPRLRLALVGSALLLVGSGSAGARLELVETGPLAELARTGGSGRMVATVVTEPRPTVGGVWFLVRVAEVDGQRSGRRAVLRLGEGQPPPALATGIVFTGSARPLEHEDFDRHLRRLHAAVAVSPTSGLQVMHRPPAVVAATTSVRSRVRAAAGRLLPDDEAALLSGLVTGDTTGLSEAAQDTLVAAGLTHLVAVSGSNVALVLAGTVGLAGVAGIGARGRRRLAVVALLWFVLLVRAEPSVLRASVMAGLVLAAGALGRGSDARHTLGVTTVVLLVIDPLLAGQLGFSLSVLATAGVLIGGPALAERLPAPRPLAVLAGASAGAQLGVAPVLLAVQGGVPLGALPANLIAVPLAAAASAVGVTAALAAQVNAAAAGLVAAVAWPALSGILRAGAAFSTSPVLTPAHLATPAAGVVVLAALVRRRSPRLALACVAVVVLVTVGGPWARAPDVTALTLTALDVGQGDALLVEVPAGGGAPPARMLVDGGPDHDRALAQLRSRGVRFLDVVAVSHPHADHTNGLPAILSRTTAGALLVGPAPLERLEEPAASATAVEAVAAQRDIPVVRVHAGQRFALGRATVEVLSPPADGSLGSEPNDNSLVLRVTDGADSLLLTGDAEEAAQRRLLLRPDLLAADVLKVPHHGGNTNAEGFVAAVGAHTAVIGVGEDNDYGHPAPEVLADLEGVRVLRTDVGGTVSVVIE